MKKCCQDSVIESILIGKPLFHVNLGINYSIKEWLNVLLRNQSGQEESCIHYFFFCQEQDFDDFPLYGERKIGIYTE